MAYMSQEKKAKIAAELKKVMPEGWKYSLAVRHHSTLVLTIRSAPLDLVFLAGGTPEDKYYSLNPYHWKSHAAPSLHVPFAYIFDVLNEGNHDKSDIQIDYFDVGWYVEVKIGEFQKPFVNTKALGWAKAMALTEGTPAKAVVDLKPVAQSSALGPKMGAVVELNALRKYLAPLGCAVESLTKYGLAELRDALAADLSPENLTCDGELSDAAVAVKLKELKAVQEDIAKIEYLLGW